MTIIKHLIDASQGKHPITTRRSSEWPKVRKEHLSKFPACAVCGRTEKIEVHHIRPFHLHPELELDPNNFISLCESDKGGVNCHLHFGHLGNFKSFNVDVKKDAEEWSEKINNRPMKEI